MKKKLFILGTSIFLGIMLTYFTFKGNTTQIPDVYINALRSSGHGCGYDPRDQERKRHYPMAHALIISSESNRYLYTHNRTALEQVIQNTDWLVENKDINKNGIVGWGLPFAWDAFGDGSKNPSHTEYIITTALSVQGLLDAIDTIDKSNIITKFIYRNKRNLYLKVAQAAIDSFIENKFYTENPEGTIFFWCSSQKSDAKFVTNCHSMFIGVFQRISTYSIEEKKKIYQDLADKGVKYLLKAKKEKNSGWYWIYYPESKNPREDDGVHAAYTADGLLMYKKCNGRLSPEIDEQKILNGLKLYIKDDKVLEMFSRPERVPRSWDLGYFLYVVSAYYPQENKLQEIIFQDRKSVV